MDLTTQCPQCGTTFLVNLEQLQLRKGYIRCVQCAYIFDGYEAVIPTGSIQGGSSLPVGLPTESSEPSGPTPSVELATSPKPLEPSEPVAPPLMPSVVRARREFRISVDHTPDASTTEPVLGGSDNLVREPVSERDGMEPNITNWDAVHVRVDTDARPTPPRHAGKRRRKRKIVASPRRHGVGAAMWLVLIVAGIFLFAAQLVYVFRVQLAENIPATRPGLERMCDALRCTVAYSRQPDMIIITRSSLQGDPEAGDDKAGNKAGDTTMLLELTLRNAYDKPQEWPTLVLNLEDFSGTSIARKNLPKDVYLPANMAYKPFPASSEQRIALPLAMQGLKVNGYQLTTFFP